MPEKKAQPSVYDPLKEKTLVVEALNVGRLAMGKLKNENSEVLKKAIMQFVSKYGLLGFMPAIPITPDFIDYDAVYLPKNHFIKKKL